MKASARALTLTVFIYLLALITARLATDSPEDRAQSLFARIVKLGHALDTAINDSP